MRHLIVGASAAGLAAAESLLAVDPGAEVTLLSEEPDPPYCRPLISYWLAGESPDSLFALAPDLLPRVELRLGCRAVRLDAPEQRLVTEAGESLAYDRLLLATGARSKSLGLPGEGLANVHGFRTLADARALAAEVAAGASRAVVLGAGLVGVKAAHALAARGVATVLALGSSHPLSQTVDERAGRLAAETLAEEGVHVRPGLVPSAFEASAGRATAVAFRDGSKEACDVVVVAKGVEPRVELGGEPGAGIAVDERLEARLRNVWAAGDAARTHDFAWGRPRLNAVWPMAVEQGALAGRNMAGCAEVYPGSVGMNSVRIGALDLMSAGVTCAPDPSYEERFSLDRRRRVYRKIVLRDGRLVGAIFAGAADAFGLLASAVRRGARLDELPFDPLDERPRWRPSA